MKSCDCGRDLDQSGLCEMCYAEKIGIAARVKEALGSKRAVEEFSIEKFRPEFETDRRALNLAANFTALSNLYLCGPVGCGKTHIATIALRRLIERGLFGRIMLPSEVCREAWSQSSQVMKSEFIRRIAALPGLVLDDMGAEPPTDDTRQVLFEIINRRWLAKGGGLIVTSNLSLDELAQRFGDDRITSRLFEMCELVQWPANAPDRRMKKS